MRTVESPSKVKAIEDRSRNRVNAFKWLAGLLWAGFLYTFSKTFEPSLAGADNAIKAFALFFAVLMAYFLVWGYEAALDKLFKTIEIGCNDFCYEAEA